MEVMFWGVTLSTENYDSLLISWSQLSLQSGVRFHAGNTEYSVVSETARQYIIDTYDWVIIDGGKAQIPEEEDPLKIKIPGYNIYLLVGLVIGLLQILIRKLRKGKN